MRYRDISREDFVSALDHCLYSETILDIHMETEELDYNENGEVQGGKSWVNSFMEDGGKWRRDGEAISAQAIREELFSRIEKCKIFLVCHQCEGIFFYQAFDEKHKYIEAAIWLYAPSPAEIEKRMLSALVSAGKPSSKGGRL